MAQLGRSDLNTLATTTNVNDNTTKDINPSKVRNQYDNERDSTINIIDDEIIPKNTSGEKTLELNSPPTLSNLGTNDVPTRALVEELIVNEDTNPNFKNIAVATYDLEDTDNGKFLYHDLTTSEFTIPLGSTLEIFTINTKSSNTTNVTLEIGVTLVDYFGNSLSNWTSTSENKTAIFTKISLNNYRVTEIKEVESTSNPVSFTVNSDAPVSDDIAFNDIITIDASSLVTHPFISSATFEFSLDGSTYTLCSTLTALQTQIDNFGSGVTYVIRAIGVYNTGDFGSATIGFSFN